MNSSNVTLEGILASLADEDLIPDETTDRATALIEAMHAVQPWYIRAMVGFGAWLASLLLIGFVAGLSLAMDGGYVVVGLGMIVAAVILRKRFSTDFMVQSTLAISLAGQGLFAFGIADFKLTGNYEATLIAIIVMSSILFVVFPDRIHRVLSVMFASSALAVLIYVQELNPIVPLLGPAYAAGLIFLCKGQPRLAASGLSAALRPLMTGIMLSAFGFLFLSTIYVLPELGIDYAFYPRPWISTVLLGALFIYLGTGIWPQLVGPNETGATAVIYGLMGIVVAAAWAAPGLLLALIVVMLGASSGNRVFTASGIVFLAVFLGAYFYGIQITMLTKSMTLVATGMAILLARYLILRIVLPTEREPANA